MRLRDIADSLGDTATIVQTVMLRARPVEMARIACSGGLVGVVHSVQILLDSHLGVRAIEPGALMVRLSVAVAGLAVNDAIPLAAFIALPILKAVGDARDSGAWRQWIADLVQVAEHVGVCLVAAAAHRVEDLAVRVILAFSADLVRLEGQRILRGL